jgi:CheY-like chemotaxis protein
MEKIKILIVEDENILALGLKKKLENLGYAVTDIAASGAETIEKIANNKPDLILMDKLLKEILTVLKLQLN